MLALLCDSIVVLQIALQSALLHLQITARDKGLRYQVCAGPRLACVAVSDMWRYLLN